MFSSAPKLCNFARAISVLFIFVAGPAIAQDFLYDAVSPDSVSREQIETAIALVESRQDLDAETRSLVTDYLLDAQVQIQSRLSAESAAATFAASLETAPAETAALRLSLDQELPEPPAPEDFGLGDAATLTELEQKLAEESADLAALDSELAVLRARQETELARPVAIRERIGQLRKSREEFAAIANTREIVGEQQIVANARTFSAGLSVAAKGAEINRLEQELLTHGARFRLLLAQRDVAARKRLELNARVSALREAVAEKYQTSATQAQESAAATTVAMADMHPAIRSLAAENAALTQELPQRAAAAQNVSNQLESVRSELADIEQRLARSKRRLEIEGMSRTLGSLLIAERRNLPSISQYRAELRARDRDAAEVSLERIRIQDLRRELASVDQKVEEIVSAISADISDPAELATNKSNIRPLLLARRDLLLQTEDSYSNYLQVLGDLDIEQRRLLDAIERYKQFFAENLLWIPSAQIFGIGIVSDGLPSYPQALSAQAWLSVASQLTESVGKHVAAAVLCAALLLVLLLLFKPLGRLYTSMSERVGRLSSDSIVLTLSSMAIVAIRAAPLPLLIFSIAWFLDNGTQPSAFSDAVARCLYLTTPFFYNVLFFRALSAPGGIFGLHFGWQEKTVATIRKQLHRLAIVGGPLILATALLFLSDAQSDRATLGRLAFFALMIYLSSAVYPILHPEKGIVAAHYRRLANAWTTRLRWVWFGIGVGLPLLLVVVSFFGFLYTSTILAGLFVTTFWRVLALVVLYLVVLRWLALARRKLALQLAQKEHETRQAELQGESESDSGMEQPPTEVPMDLDEVDQQTKKLLRSVMLLVALLVAWDIWADVLPALSFLNEVGLWTETVMIDGAEALRPVTLADLLLAITIIVITVIASRNLPGLMEILILQRLSLAPGSRYAINTLVRYTVVTIGTFSVLSLIGWNWSQIQWLVAALSVGLGFGLQEIVANFISGLIILFEKPVRVGDTVTVGELTGTVSKIRIRATTITDWDRKEILVPNKSFITAQVINWTLSDPITRVVIPVGVAYRSDVDLTREVMSNALRSVPLVLDEPPPKVYFTGFGDSSLHFTVHAYLRQLSDRLPLVHEVHESILKALRENGIEIPFPQRDIHIRSTAEKS